MDSMDEGMFDAGWPGVDLATVPITAEQPHGYIVIGRPDPHLKFRLMGLKVFHQSVQVALAERTEMQGQLPGWEIEVLECQAIKAP